MADEIDREQLNQVLVSEPEDFKSSRAEPDKLEVTILVAIPPAARAPGRAPRAAAAVSWQEASRLFEPGQGRLKRALDLALLALTAPVTLPLVVLLALAVKLDGDGGVFFAHGRIGRGDRPIRVWKFRTMVRNAHHVLADHLARDPALAAEWARTQKLRNDPRITRIGRFLRRTSLDEVPQLWNVLKGEMSLVGPRPIIPDEVQRYGVHFKLYTRVRPGLTGLWQVSGRNNLSYDDRVRLDVCYVHHWSIWMDMRILARTIAVVLSGRGAF